MVGREGGETKVTPVTGLKCLKYLESFVGTALYGVAAAMSFKITGVTAPFQEGSLIQITHRASAGTPRIATGTAPAGGRRCARRSLGGNCEYRELGIKSGGVALWALRFRLAVNESLELMMAFLTYVLEDRHRSGSGARIQLH
jgi:hypothetical protein